MIWHLILIFAAFLVLWSSADLIVDGVAYLAAKVKLADFWVSFFVLGLAMTAPEISVGINSVIDGNPEVFVANLLGSTVSIFLLVIPLMAILGNGVTLIGKISNNKMIFSLGLVLVPFLLIADGKMDMVRAIGCLFYYFLLAIYFALRAGEEKVVNTIDKRRLKAKPFLAETVKFSIGVALILFSGDVLLDSLEFVTSFLGSSLYVVSFFMLSFGTTAPELMLVAKSIMFGKRDIAFGGYLGSAVANSLMFGGFSLAAGSFVLDRGVYFKVLFGLFLVGMLLFYYFSKSKDELSKKEGIILILTYILVVVITASF